MKTTQIILFIFLIASVAFTILKLPGQFFFLLVVIFSTTVFMLFRSIKEAINLKFNRTPKKPESILESDLILISEKKKIYTLKFVIALTLLLACTYLLFRYQFWRSWIVIQYLALILVVYLGYRFAVGNSSNRLLILSELKRHWMATIIALGAIVMAVVPYSTFIHWNEFDRGKITSGKRPNSNDPCAGVRRYLWALEREGKFKKIEQFKKDKEEICFFPE